MSVEMITVLVGIVSILLAFGSGFGWMVHRMDARIDRVEQSLGSRIDRMDQSLGSRIDRVEQSLGSRIDRVETELVEVKIAIARVEGPPRHFQTAR